MEEYNQGRGLIGLDKRGEIGQERETDGLGFRRGWEMRGEWVRGRLG